MVQSGKTNRKRSVLVSECFGDGVRSGNIHRNRSAGKTRRKSVVLLGLGMCFGDGFIGLER